MWFSRNSALTSLPNLWSHLDLADRSSDVCVGLFVIVQLVLDGGGAGGGCREGGREEGALGCDQRRPHRGQETSGTGAGGRALERARARLVHEAGRGLLLSFPPQPLTPKGEFEWKFIIHEITWH